MLASCYDAALGPSIPPSHLSLDVVASVDERLEDVAEALGLRRQDLELARRRVVHVLQQLLPLLVQQLLELRAGVTSAPPRQPAVGLFAPVPRTIALPSHLIHVAVDLVLDHALPLVHAVDRLLRQLERLGHRVDLAPAPPPNGPYKRSRPCPPTHAHFFDGTSTALRTALLTSPPGAGRPRSCGSRPRVPRGCTCSGDRCGWVMAGT